MASGLREDSDGVTVARELLTSVEDRISAHKAETLTALQVAIANARESRLAEPLQAAVKAASDLCGEDEAVAESIREATSLHNTLLQEQSLQEEAEAEAKRQEEERLTAEAEAKRQEEARLAAEAEAKRQEEERLAAEAEALRARLVAASESARKSRELAPLKEALAAALAGGAESEWQEVAAAQDLVNEVIRENELAVSAVIGVGINGIITC